MTSAMALDYCILHGFYMYFDKYYIPIQNLEAVTFEMSMILRCHFQPLGEAELPPTNSWKNKYDSSAHQESLKTPVGFHTQQSMALK